MTSMHVELCSKLGTKPNSVCHTGKTLKLRASRVMLSWKFFFILNLMRSFLVDIDIRNFHDIMLHHTHFSSACTLFCVFFFHNHMMKAMLLRSTELLSKQFNYYEL